jgi:hypothetical protein
MMTNLSALRWIVTVVLVAAAVPARGQTSGACQAVEEEEAPRRPRSAAELRRDSLKSAIVDTLRTEVMSAAQGAGIAEPAGIVFVQRLNRGTGEARVWSFRGNVPDSLSQQVVARRADLLVRWPEREAFTNFRLDRLDVPDDPSVECLPRVADVGQLARDLGRIASRFTAEPSNNRVQLQVKMLVTRDGEVAHAEISRGNALRPVVEAVLELARGLRFAPASLDGVPVEVWVVQPVNFDLPIRQPRRSSPE